MGDDLVEFSNKEIMRAKRDLQNCFDDVRNNTSRFIYIQNIKRLINLLDSNKVLNIISKPFFEMEIKEIEYDDDDWIELDIPVEMEKQIAFVFQKLREIASKDIDIFSYLYSIYRNKYMDNNVNIWNQELIYPTFREIMIRLNDLIEDKVEGKEIVDGSILNIKYNIKNISVGNNSNFAIGEDISQNINSNEVFDKLLKATEKINNDEEKNDIIQCINDMRDNRGNKSFMDKYNSFIQNAANHMTLFTPLIPLLTPLLTNLK